MSLPHRTSPSRRPRLSREARIIEDNWDYITGYARHPNVAEAQCLNPEDRRDQWASLCVYAALAGMTPLEMFEDADIYQHDGICRVAACMSQVNGQAVQARYCAAHRYPRSREAGDKLERPGNLPALAEHPSIFENGYSIDLREYERNGDAHFW